MSINLPTDALTSGLLFSAAFSKNFLFTDKLLANFLTGKAGELERIGPGKIAVASVGVDVVEFGFDERRVVVGIDEIGIVSDSTTGGSIDAVKESIEVVDTSVMPEISFTASTSGSITSLTWFVATFEFDSLFSSRFTTTGSVVSLFILELLTDSIIVGIEVTIDDEGSCSVVNDFDSVTPTTPSLTSFFSSSLFIELDSGSFSSGDDIDIIVGKGSDIVWIVEEVEGVVVVEMGDELMLFIEFDWIELVVEVKVDSLLLIFDSLNSSSKFIQMIYIIKIKIDCCFIFC